MERSFWSTIRGKLLSRTLLVVLIPLLIIGGTAIYALTSLSRTADGSVDEARSTLSDDVVGNRVAGVADQIAREIAIYLDERLHDVEGWSRDVDLVNAARVGRAEAIELGLDDLTIDEAEARFEGEPRLGNAAVARTLSDAVANSSDFKEIFFTDRNGFNVEYSNPTSDFVQSDEQWWITAMGTGLDISEPEFDASAGVFAVDVSMRLDAEGEPVGVLKSSLDIALVQQVADRYAGGAEEFQVAILDSDGRFLAETASNHDPSHIMSTTYVAADAVFTNPLIGEAMAPNGRELHPEGYSIHEGVVGGFAHVSEQLDGFGDDMTDSRALNWRVIVEQPSDVAFASLAPLQDLSDDVNSTSRTLILLLVAIALAGAVAAAVTALIFGRRLASPITRLRDAALEASEVTLPTMVARIDDLEPDEELPAVEPVQLETGDEVEDLAQSFNSVQQTAIDLAGEQARLRRKNVATTFVNLGRRNQNLLSRQLQHINSMEASETDPATLERLFKLDHLATRMRRNAESLLVLAGEDTPRRFRRPVTMHQLLQAAGGEIEDFNRVELVKVDDALIEGGVASDVAHLVAELLENASSFSPPNAPIQVHGRLRPNGYAIAIVDQGIGMEDAELQAANARLADPAEFDRAPSAYLGHFVVGHLARRHGLRVWLSHSHYAGITAQVMIADSFLVAGDEPTGEPTAIPASTVVEEASPDTHVAKEHNETARELAEIAELEEAFQAASSDEGHDPRAASPAEMAVAEAMAATPTLPPAVADAPARFDDPFAVEDPASSGRSGAQAFADVAVEDVAPGAFGTATQHVDAAPSAFTHSVETTPNDMASAPAEAWQDDAPGWHDEPGGWHDDDASEYPASAEPAEPAEPSEPAEPAEPAEAFEAPTEVFEPVVEPVAHGAEVFEPVVEPVAHGAEVFEPVVEPMALGAEVFEPVAGVAPVAEPVSAEVFEPVAGVAPVAEPVSAEVFEPVAEIAPVTERTDPAADESGPDEWDPYGDDDDLYDDDLYDDEPGSYGWVDDDPAPSAAMPEEPTTIEPAAVAPPAALADEHAQFPQPVAETPIPPAAPAGERVQSPQPVAEPDLPAPTPAPHAVAPSDRPVPNATRARLDETDAVTTAEPAASAASAAPAAEISEWTASGFRRRQRGREGAPQTPTAAAAPTSASRRSPDEVRDAMQRFRNGVEAGRAQARRDPAPAPTEGASQ